MTRSTSLSIILLSLLLTAHPLSAAPHPIKLSRGLFDFLADKPPTPTPTNPPTDTDQSTILFTPTPLPQSLTTPEPTPEDTSPTSTPSIEQPTVTPIPELTPVPSPVQTSEPDQFITFDPDGEQDEDDDDPEETQQTPINNDGTQDRSAPQSVLPAATGGLSALALVAIVVAVLAPAIFIYWGIRRRNTGFENMPAAPTDANTYRGQGREQFSVDDE